MWLRLGDAEFKAARYDEAADAWRRAATLPAPDARIRAASPPHVPEVSHHVRTRRFGLARVALVTGDPGGARDILERVVRDLAVLRPRVPAAGRQLPRARPRRPRRSGPSITPAGSPAFAPFADPIVDGLTRQSRNSTLLLRVASEATLTVNAAWSEYLTRRAVEFEPDNPDAVLKLARVLRTLERNEEALRLVPEVRRDGARRLSRRWRTSAAASARSAATRRPRTTSAARWPASTTRPRTTTWDC